MTATVLSALTSAPLEPDRISRREVVYDAWYRLSRLEVTLADGTRLERHLLDNGHAVAVLPYDPVHRTVLLVTQMRAAVLAAGDPPVLEAIAGNLRGEDPEMLVRKEAMEEAGVRLGALEAIANIWPIPPVCSERVLLYLAEYRAEDRLGPGGGAADEGERIAVHEIGLDELRARALGGTLPDAKTLILALTLIIRRPELWPDTSA